VTDLFDGVDEEVIRAVDEMLPVDPGPERERAVGGEPPDSGLVAEVERIENNVADMELDLDGLEGEL
jgi:hypothetical protein